MDFWAGGAEAGGGGGYMIKLHATFQEGHGGADIICCMLCFCVISGYLQTFNQFMVWIVEKSRSLNLQTQALLSHTCLLLQVCD